MIEFIEGEKYCRYNDTLMSTESMMKQFGAVELIYDNEDNIIGYFDDGLAMHRKSIAELLIKQWTFIAFMVYEPLL